MAGDERDPDLYQVLGVEPAASAAEITTAYRRLVRSLHPDSRVDQDISGGTRLAEVLAAYEVLRDPDRRASYDERRRREASHRPSPHAVAIPVRHVDPGSRPAGPMLRVGPVRLDPGPPLMARPARPAVRAVPVEPVGPMDVIEALLRGWW